MQNYDHMVPLAVTKYNGTYYVILNDTIYTDNTSFVYLAQMNDAHTELYVLDYLEYDISFFKQLSGQNGFSKYTLYNLLSKYSFFTQAAGGLYANIPYQSNDRSTVSMAFMPVSTEFEIFDFSNIIFSDPNVIMKGINFYTETKYSTINFNINTQELIFANYDLNDNNFVEYHYFSNINIDKNKIFVKNTLQEDMPLTVVANTYTNQFKIFSPEVPQLDKTFGSIYDTEIVSAFWINTHSPQLILFGNTLIFNQYDANFLYIIPQTSLLE